MGLSEDEKNEIIMNLPSWESFAKMEDSSISGSNQIVISAPVFGFGSEKIIGSPMFELDDSDKNLSSPEIYVEDKKEEKKEIIVVKEFSLNSAPKPTQTLW